MDRLKLPDLVQAVLKAGGRLSLEDGKPVLIADRPLPTVLTEQLLARQAELVELLGNGSAKPDADLLPS